jgi:parvulin-like peptidyl-prolyl isomerase
MSYRFVFISVCLLALLSCSPENKKIASVGGRLLTQKQLDIFIKEHDGQRSREDFVLREVACALAGREGLPDKADFKIIEQKTREEVLAKLFLETKIPHTDVSEKDARDFYTKHREKRLVSHILFKTREEAEIAKNRIKGGEGFEAVAKELSLDTATRDKGGDLGWIMKGMTVPEFEDTLFSAKKGELAGPVKTEYGFHLILLRDLTEPSAVEFEKNKDQVLEAMKRNKFDTEKDNLLKSIREKYPLAGNDEVLGQDRTTEVFTGDDKSVAGTVAGFDISLKELKVFIADVMKIKGGGHSLGPNTKLSFMEILADDKRIIKAAEDEKLDKSDDFALLYDDAVKDKTYTAFRGIFLKSFEPAEPDLRQFYEQDKKLFKTLDGVRLNIIVTATSDGAQKAILESASSDFKSLYEKYADKEATGDMDTGVIEVSSLAKFFPPTSIEQLGGGKTGEIIGPFRFQDGYVVMKIIEKIYKDSPSFDYSKDKVKNEFIKQKGDESFRNYLNGEGQRKVKAELFS